MERIDIWTWHLILDYLSIKEISRFRCVCRYFKSTADCYGLPRISLASTFKNRFGTDFKAMNQWTPVENAWFYPHRLIMPSGIVLGTYLGGNAGSFAPFVDNLEDFLNDKLGLEPKWRRLIYKTLTTDFKDEIIQLAGLPCSEEEGLQWLESNVKLQNIKIQQNIQQNQMVPFSLVLNLSGKVLGNVWLYNWQSKSIDEEYVRIRFAEFLGFNEANYPNFAKLLYVRKSKQYQQQYEPYLIGIPASQDNNIRNLSSVLDQLITNSMAKKSTPFLH